MLTRLTLIGSVVLAVCGLLVTDAALDVASQMSDMNMPAMHHAHASSETAPNANANANEIVIENFAFQPATLTVKVGTKVTWVNRDDEPHTATATDKRFNSKTLENGEQFSTEFDQPGTYNYYCALHPKMTGQIIVK